MQPAIVDPCTTPEPVGDNQHDNSTSEDRSFLKKMICFVCCCTCCCYVCWGCYLLSLILSTNHVASIVMGSLYLHDCPCERFIPIFLIVIGVVGLLISFWHWRNGRQKTADDESLQESQRHSQNTNNVKKAGTKTELLCAFIACFIVGWTIAGAVWVFSIHNDYQSDDPTGEDYCNDTCYKYAFGEVIVMMIAEFFFWLKWSMNTGESQENEAETPTRGRPVPSPLSHTLSFLNAIQAAVDSEQVEAGEDQPSTVPSPLSHALSLLNAMASAQAALDSEQVEAGEDQPSTVPSLLSLALSFLNAMPSAQAAVASRIRREPTIHRRQDVEDLPHS